MMINNVQFISSSSSTQFPPFQIIKQITLASDLRFLYLNLNSSSDATATGRCVFVQTLFLFDISWFNFIIYITCLSPEIWYIHGILVMRIRIQIHKTTHIYIETFFYITHAYNWYTISLHCIALHC